MTSVDFWYDFASTYSYPAAMRIEALAQERELDVVWRPFLLGPIFADLGWRNSPFNIFPVKGRYMWRDLERICARYGLAFQPPDPFPQNSLLAVRAAVALDPARRPEFSRAVFHAEFALGRPIAERATLAEILTRMDLHASAVLEEAATAPVKSRLKSEVDAARRLGVFGAPMLVTDEGELFWGHDKLEEGLDWAVGRR
ncbi:MAG: 2-hydroxychromene-2-carboxylate isomerase [Beijerinckiaceae bacterium]|jgi:2-hydroxychromene-2-carboxylate isomerase|nr:2-hydroxychromene-2-carboxylate isomerase [Beijerinckiaceae bacterium]MDO9441873.1 2-hydroxychromene-2-carboxylate isomerase [Beijerinckiaceae bacterium]